jgi:hypothetical protein
MLTLTRFAGPLLVLLLAACSSNPEVAVNPATDAVASIPKAAARLAPSTLPLWTTPGAWRSPPQGPLFEQMDTLDPRNAMVYVYRPSTSWEDQELQAPSFFIDGMQVFGLKSGSYVWMELHGGSYQLYAKRPLLIFYIKKIFETDIEVQGGKTYYLRYSEADPFDYAAHGLDPEKFMHDGFLQEVPESIAVGEIASLKLDQPGVYFAGGQVQRHDWKPFDTFPETGLETALVEEVEPEVPQEKRTWWSRAFGEMF